MTLAFETVGGGHLRDLDPETGDVRWQILGPVAATRQGAALDLGAPRQRAVLTLLLSRAGDTVPLARIVEAVWGQDPPRYAVSTVHKHVGALRRVVEPGLPCRAQGHWLQSDARGYRITGDERTLDLLRFRALAARARHRRDPAERDRNDTIREEFVMLFLAESHNTGDSTQYLEAETVRIGELMRAGIVETVLVKADQSGALLLVRSADLASAREAVESLPLAVHGLASVEFTGVIAIDSIPGDLVPQSAT